LSTVDELPERPPVTPRSRPRRPRPDQRAVRTRRLIAFGVAGLLLVGLIFLIKGCRDAAREQAFKDYARNVGQMIDQSNQESRALFGLLSNSGGQTPVELQTNANGYRTDAAGLVLRAKGQGHPDELAQAQAYLVELLEFRRDGIGSVADQLPSALAGGTQSRAAARVAAAMQDFLTSDVLFRQRLIPSLETALSKAGLLASVQLPTSRFLPDLGWLDGSTTASRLAALTGGSSTGGARRLSIDTVTVSPGGQTLQQSSTTQVAATPSLSFQVTLTNAGAYTQHDVVVRLQVGGAGTPVEQKVPSIDPGSQQTATIPLAATPPRGTATVQVQILPATGIQDTGTTKASFPVTFSG
jgi:hypothetical protein